jgi:hypothetical protein
MLGCEISNRLCFAVDEFGAELDGNLKVGLVLGEDAAADA